MEVTNHLNIGKLAWLGAVALLLLTGTQLRAGYWTTAVFSENSSTILDQVKDQKTENSNSANSGRPGNWQKLQEAWQNEWEEMRAALVRCLLETSMTMFLINVPKTQTKDPGGTPNLPNDPGGSGTTNPGDPSDPGTTPEPSSLVCALLGVILMSWYAWRRRLTNRPSFGFHRTA
jgi:hypothetical protein